ncbi:TPA: hypothetical protein DEP21_03660 [Patescibacteria group bacterium]|nr:hypothetical protein [Candidatus Gracilibacteria bacterium]
MHLLHQEIYHILTKRYQKLTPQVQEIWYIKEISSPVLIIAKIDHTYLCIFIDDSLEIKQNHIYCDTKDFTKKIRTLSSFEFDQIKSLLR